MALQSIEEGIVLSRCWNTTYGVQIVIKYIDLLKIITTSHSVSTAKSYTVQFTTALTLFVCSLLTSSFLSASNGVASLASVLHCSDPHSLRLSHNQFAVAT
jgi:hypothetical protein